MKTLTLRTSEIRVSNEGDYLAFEVNGDYQLADAKELIRHVQEECRECKMNRALIDYCGVSGKVTDLDRYELGVFISKNMDSQLKSALVYIPEEINNFMERVAMYRGSQFKVFHDEKKALNWLLED